MDGADTVSQVWWISLGPDVMLKGSLCFGEEDFRALVQNSWRGSNQMGTKVLKVVQHPAGKGKHLLGQPCRQDHSSLERDAGME